MTPLPIVMLRGAAWPYIFTWNYRPLTSSGQGVSLETEMMSYSIRTWSIMPENGNQQDYQTTKGVCP
jgi:hypothetical protein